MKTEIWIVRLVDLFLEWRRETWGCVMEREGKSDMAVPGLAGKVGNVLQYEMKGRMPSHGIRVIVDRDGKRFKIEAILCKDGNRSIFCELIDATHPRPSFGPHRGHPQVLHIIGTTWTPAPWSRILTIAPLPQ